MYMYLSQAENHFAHIPKNRFIKSWIGIIFYISDFEKMSSRKNYPFNLDLNHTYQILKMILEIENKMKSLK